MSNIHNFRQYGSDSSKIQEVNEANTARSTSTIVATTQIVDQYGNVISKDAANTARTTATKVIPIQHIDATGKVQPAGEANTNPIFIKLTDGTDEVGIDGISLKVIDNPHSAVHQGNHYITEYLFTSVANDAYADLHIANGSGNELHFGCYVVPEYKSYFYMYEGTTYTNNGTALTIVNNNRTGTPNTADSNAYHTPTIDTIGATILIPGRLIPASSRSAGTGAAGNSREELVLEVSEDYLIRVQSKAGAGVTNDISIVLEWYEVAA